MSLLHFDWVNDGLFFVLVVVALVTFGVAAGRAEIGKNTSVNRPERRRERSPSRRTTVAPPTALQ